MVIIYRCILYPEPSFYRKWQTTLDFDESDYDEFGRTSPTEAERHTVEQAKETAETSQLTTSEQEERQTFVITGWLVGAQSC